MSRFKVLVIVVGLAVLTSAGGPAVAQDDGNLASITYWSIADGTTVQFEAGLKAHNQLHAAQGDPVPLLTWVAVSGPHNGKYGRGSFGHSWSDFDQDPEALEADNADSAIHITPYIEAAEPTIWAAMPELSNAMDAPGAVTRIIEFAVHPGQGFAFEQAVGKIHAALSKHDWPNYEWYELVDGGRTPTYVVALPRENWAGFAPGDKSFMDALTEEYGEEEAMGILQGLGAATESQLSYTLVLRPDLSYMPGADG